jgi:endonuclease/exonuclease/phosphatase family metal-dependent hydrolase
LNAVISPIDADVIGFQESTPRWMEHIERDFGNRYEIFYKYRSSVAPFESTPVLWKKDKFDCIKKGYFWFSDTPDEESRGWDGRYPYPRICTYVILREKTSGRAFVFMSAHLGFGDDCQKKSCALVPEYAAKLSDLPTFIVGDFNMTPKSPGYAVMTEKFTDVNAVTSRDMSTTFHAYKDEDRPDAHIDFCFIDDKITPISQKILNGKVNGKYPSDHFGLQIELEIN